MPWSGIISLRMGLNRSLWRMRVTQSREEYMPAAIFGIDHHGATYYMPASLDQRDVGYLLLNDLDGGL